MFHYFKTQTPLSTRPTPFNEKTLNDNVKACVNLVAENEQLRSDNDKLGLENEMLRNKVELQETLDIFENFWDLRN